MRSTKRNRNEARKNRRRNQPSRRTNLRPMLEPLEDRRLLAGYSVVDLGFLDSAAENGWYDNEWNDINNAGQIAGRSGESAVLWNPDAAGGGTGSIINLGKLPADNVAVAQSISSNGLVSGTSVRWATIAGEQHSQTPFLWVPDTPNGDTGSFLTIDTTSGWATGVNSHGRVVGSYDHDDQQIARAFVWERDAGGAAHLTNLNDAVPRDQLTAQGIESDVILHEATAINDSNQIVVNGFYGEDTDGDGYFDLSKSYAFLVEDDNGSYYDGGITITHLGSLGGYVYTYATDINASGQITGESDSPARKQGRHAFLWQDGVMNDLGTLGRDTESRARAISDNGTVVGESSSSPFPSSYSPFIWQNGQMVDLSNGLGNESYWTLRWAWGVNDDAQVIGTGIAPHTSEQDDWRGYLLTTDTITLPKLSIGDATVVEGDLDILGKPVLTTVELEVTLSEPAAESITVDYFTAGSYEMSIPDEDFVSKSSDVTFQPGETSKTITVQVIGDLLAGGATHDQGDEFFSVSLNNPRNASGMQAAVFYDAQGNVTIIEDEPSMSIADIQLPEGDSGLKPFTFTVSLSGPAKAPVSVDWHTEDNTAVAGVDYVAATGTLVIDAGESNGEITVQVIGDTTVEETNSFRVVLEAETSVNADVIDGYAYGFVENDDGGGKKGGGRGKPNRTSSSTAELLIASEVKPLTTDDTKVQAQGKGKGNGSGNGDGGEVPSPIIPAITFTDGKDIFVTDQDGVQSDRIVRSGNQKEGPSYSPDGSKLVYFQEIRNGYIYQDLYEANADGSGKPQLLKSFDGSADSFPNYDSGGDYDPVPDPDYHDWTPDGEVLVFSSETDAGDLFVWRPDAPNEIQALGLADFSTWFHSVSIGPDLDASTTEYEGWLAYTASEDGPAAVGGRFDLHLVRVNQQPDGFLQIDPSTLVVQRVADEDPDFAVWSPDGSQIAYRLAGALLVVDMTTTATTASFGSVATVYQDSGVYRAAAWSPDGEWLAFSAATGSHYDLFRVRADGSDLTQITDTHRKDELFPSWSPTWIDPATQTASQSSGLYIAALDTFYANDEYKAEVDDELLMTMALDRLF